MRAISLLTRYDLPAILDGAEVWGDDRFDVRYPYTGEVIGSAPKLSREDVVRARTRPRRRVRPVAARAGAACSWHRRPVYQTEPTPFGGTGDSGLGVKEGVIEAMRAMMITTLYTLPWD